MSELRVNAVTDETGGNTATINGMTPTADSLQGFRNRLINGNMVLDQRNAGASVTITNTGAATYTLDRWAGYGSQASKFSVQQNAGAVTPPSGFSNYLGVTSLSAYAVSAGDIFVVIQNIEGYNVADFGWGSAGAQSVTLSFWVRSSLTGAFGGAVRNSADTRSYPFTYSVSAANTWEQKTITIAGDTTGTWLTTNGVGIRVVYGLGVGATYSGTAGAWAGASYQSATGATSVVGTSGATFYITGVQLEAGSVATPFERRPYGTELALCQRYFSLGPSGASGRWNSSTAAEVAYAFRVEMRAAPTVTHLTNYSAPNAGVTNITITATSISDTSNTMGTLLNLTGSGASGGGICIVRGNGAGFSAEL